MKKVAIIPIIILDKMSETFSHINKKGTPQMVDVGNKTITKRTAVAQSIIVLPPEVVEKIEQNEIQTKKGAVFQTAILAGIMAAKQTANLIPLCHPLGLDNCSVEIELNAAKEAVITCTCAIESKTGVEMEALTGASIAALTVYDMCKAFSHDMVIKETKLVKKSGGKRDVAN